MIRNLEKLWNLTNTNRFAFKESENLYFDPIGLNLFRELQCWDYWCTPTNTITFATTGGDGVHFGFLCEKGAATDSSPIVMTLPCADTSNIIVGESLTDFLSLGCRLGYFELEQIEYQPNKYIPFLDTHSYSEDSTTREIEMLEEIESEFNLVPWNNHEKRLSELQKKYIDRLKYSDEYYEITT